MATKKGREQSKRETWESLKEEGNKLFSHRKYEQGNRRQLHNVSYCYITIRVTNCITLDLSIETIQ